MYKKLLPDIKKAFIFAAGKGLRFYPYSSKIPKSLFTIDGESLLVRNIRLINQAFPNLDQIIILVGYLGDAIKKELVSNNFNSKLRFLEVSEYLVSTGLIGGFAAIKHLVEKDEIILCALADEFYGGADHSRFAEFIKENEIGGCCFAMKRMSNIEEYIKNYAVIINEKKEVERVVEKPSVIESEYFGLGLFAVRGGLCQISYENISSKGITIIDLFNSLETYGYGRLKGFIFDDYYVNINTRFDIYNCLREIRTKFQPTIDVVIPAWNEAESISFVIKDFLPYVRSVVVMDNMSSDGTAEISRKAGAIVYSASYKGYGDAIKRGLDSSTADILVIVEADGTFRAKDLPKLITYMSDADAVIGSRTHWQYLEYGANMKFLQRMANLLYGLLITLLWWNRHSRFTDVGCSYRSIWRTSYKEISKKLNQMGPAFAPEFVILLLENWSRVIEVPVPYHARIFGSSKFSGSLFGLMNTALKMLYLILKLRVKGWFRIIFQINR